MYKIFEVITELALRLQFNISDTLVTVKYNPVNDSAHIYVHDLINNRFYTVWFSLSKMIALKPITLSALIEGEYNNILKAMEENK